MASLSSSLKAALGSSLSERSRNLTLLVNKHSNKSNQKHNNNIDHNKSDNGNDNNELTESAKRIIEAVKVLLACIESTEKPGPKLLESKQKLLSEIKDLVSNVKQLQTNINMTNNNSNNVEEQQILSNEIKSNLTRLDQTVKSILGNPTLNFQITEHLKASFEDIQKQSVEMRKEIKEKFIDESSVLITTDHRGKETKIKSSGLDRNALINELKDLEAEIPNEGLDNMSTADIQIIVLKQRKAIDWEYLKWEKGMNKDYEMYDIRDLQKICNKHGLEYNADTYIKRQYIALIIRSLHSKEIFLKTFYPNALHYILS